MKKVILSLVLVIVSFNAVADSFDDTGLINTTSDSAAIGSCATIADFTGNAATMVRANFVVQRPTTAAENAEKQNAVSLLTELMTVKSTNFYRVMQQLPPAEEKIARDQLVATQTRVIGLRNDHNYGPILGAYHTCTQMFNIY